MLANSPQTRLDITQTQQIARNCGLSLQTACKREVWGTASGGPYHWGGGGGGLRDRGPGSYIYIYIYMHTSKNHPAGSQETKQIAHAQRENK